MVAKCKEEGAQAVCYAGDAMKEETAEAVVRLAMETYGQIDILINNAGIGRVTKLEESTMEEYDLIMNSNVRSAYAFTLHTMPEMLKRGKGQIIMVSSVTGVYGHTEEAAYTASKFALRGLAQAIDKEFFERGIKSGVYCPSAAKTEFEVGYGRTAERVAASNNLTPEDGAETLLFMCSQPDHARVMEVRQAALRCAIF